MNFTVDDPASAGALLKRSARSAAETPAGPDPAGNIKNTKASLLVNRLREAILSGELAPGTKINLDMVRRRLDVSLSPLREALARLIAVGLVELHDNRGYTVAPVSLSNLAEITKLRVEFESLALSSAIARGDLAWESDVMRALHPLNRTERIAGESATLEAWEHAHREFHMVLIACCGMPLLLNSCVMLHNLNDRYRRIFLIAQGGDRNVAAEHSEIAQGAVARDTDYACAKLREHILRTGTNLHARLAGQLQPCVDDAPHEHVIGHAAPGNRSFHDDRRATARLRRARGQGRFLVDRAPLAPCLSRRAVLRDPTW